MMTREVRIGRVAIGAGTFTLIAGPCVIENAQMCLDVAGRIRDMAARLGIPYIFKSSFDKANRMSVDSYRGPGREEGLQVLARVKNLGVPVLTDVHSIEDVAAASATVDIIQIPALLSRQTDLVLAAARTGKPVNVKKGQFMAPWDVEPLIRKIESAGNSQIVITERGFCFGYNNLVSDFRSLGIMRAFGYPVVYDATHSVQLPGGNKSSSSGQRQFVAGLARAAVAFGCDGLFLEVHPDPDAARCDGPNMISLNDLEVLVTEIRKIREALS
jgi:2-dehydro-3-deoxyphosphooctonate aldolase (KDO 8-P synthase)